MSIKPRDELYVTLPSNVPGFTANTPSDYTTILPTPLVLSGNWEVALLETHYFNDWVNFPDTDMAIFLKAKKVVVDEGLYSAGRDKRAANSEVVEIPTPSTEVIEPSPDPNSALVVNSEVVEIPTPSTEVIEPSPDPNSALAVNSKVGEIPTPSTEVVVEQPNKIAQQIVNLEEQVRLLKEKPCPLKAPVKLPPYTTETQLKTNVFFGKMHEFLTKNGGVFGEELIPIKIPKGHYDSISQIGELITKRIDPVQQMKPNFSEITQKFEFSNKLYEMIFASLDANLFVRLGYNAQTARIDDTTFSLARVDREGDIRGTLDELNTIFVYSDIVDYQIVGNTKATLMGVFPTTGRHYEQQSWQFNPFQYMGVSSEEIRSINMVLRTPQGDPVPFLSGDSLCRLHFRRKLL